MPLSAKIAAVTFGLALIAYSGQAATLTLTNFDGVRSNPLVNASGAIATRGSVYAGSFSVSDGALLHLWRNGQISQIIENFHRFGNGISVGLNEVPGLYQDSIIATINPGGPLDGAVVYTVITNQPLSAMPDEWLIYKHGHIFLPGDAPIEPALLNESADGTLIIGEFGARTVTLGELVDRPAYELAEMIPEPASAALLVMSLALCWGRRRRA